MRLAPRTLMVFPCLLLAACAPPTSDGRTDDDDPPPDDMMPTPMRMAGRSGSPMGGSTGSPMGGSTGSPMGGSTGSPMGGSGGSTSTGGTGGSSSRGGSGGAGGSGTGGMDGGAPDTGPTTMVDMAPPRAEQTVVPIVTLDSPVSIPNEPKVDGTIKIFEQPPAMFSQPLPVAADLPMTPTFMSAMGIELRGRSTQGGNYLKKPFSIEIQNAMKTAAPRSFFGMAPEADYALLACWNDRTCMRSALGFQLANEMKTPIGNGVMWHPNFQFIEVFYKGQYNGTYNWVERVKQDRYRVAITKPAADMAAGDITGGYLLRIEFTGRGNITVGGKTYNRDFTVSPSQQVWTYFYPRADEITDAQKTYIKDWVTKMEAAVNGADRENPDTGYRKYIDVRSWVDYMIVRELAREVDSYRLSFYMTKLPDSMGGKLHAGPQWDFDRAFGNATYYDANKPAGGWSFEGPPRPANKGEEAATFVGSSRVDLQACKLEYSIVSPK